MSALNYKKAGVDIVKADRFVEAIRKHVVSTHSKNVKGGVGGYASLYQQGAGNWIAASTDGVGTKLKLAFESGIHHTVGIDLVAMSVNDLICVGAQPLFFLDYFATGKLNPKIAVDVVRGIAEGCKQAECSLVGGETAEMPSFYEPGEYDLAGFAVGSVKKAELLPRNVRAGDVLIALPSSGFHSNGYSLLRKVLPASGAERKKWVKRFLTPTKIYVKSVMPWVNAHCLTGLANITGSGMLNLPRVGEHLSYSIKLPKLSDLPQEFDYVWGKTGENLKEFTSTFNSGVGMIVVCRETEADRLLTDAKKRKLGGFYLGNVRKKKTKTSEIEVVAPWKTRGSSRALLSY